MKARGDIMSLRGTFISTAADSGRLAARRCLRFGCSTVYEKPARPLRVILLARARKCIAKCRSPCTGLLLPANLQQRPRQSCTKAPEGRCGAWACALSNREQFK